MRARLGIGYPADPIFGSATIVMTPGAERALAKSGQGPPVFLDRHFRGDWGEVDEEDRKQNDGAIKSKDMILSAYKTRAGTKILVITDPGHEITTLLLPEEY